MSQPHYWRSCTFLIEHIKLVSFGKWGRLYCGEVVVFPISWPQALSNSLSQLLHLSTMLVARLKRLFWAGRGRVKPVKSSRAYLSGDTLICLAEWAPRASFYRDFVLSSQVVMDGLTAFDAVASFQHTLNPIWDFRLNMSGFDQIYQFILLWCVSPLPAALTLLSPKIHSMVSVMKILFWNILTSSSDIWLIFRCKFPRSGYQFSVEKYKQVFHMECERTRKVSNSSSDDWSMSIKLMLKISVTTAFL